MRNFKKSISLVLSFLMVIGMLPTGLTFADTTHKVTLTNLTSTMVEHGFPNITLSSLSYNEVSGDLSQPVNLTTNNSIDAVILAFDIPDLPSNITQLKLSLTLTNLSGTGEIRFVSPVGTGLDFDTQLPEDEMDFMIAPYIHAKSTQISNNGIIELLVPVDDLSDSIWTLNDTNKIHVAFKGNGLGDSVYISNIKLEYNLPELSSDTTLTSKIPGEYDVNTGLLVVSSGTELIKVNTNAGTILNAFDVPIGASFKVFSSTSNILNATDFNNTPGITGSTAINKGSFVAVKAENGAIQKYLLVPLNDSITVTTKLSHYTVDENASTITAGNTPITTATTGAALINNLEIPIGAKTYVAGAGAVFADVFVLKASTHLHKNKSLPLEDSDRLWILSEDELIFTSYTISVTSLSSDKSVTSKNVGGVVVDEDNLNISSGSFKITKNTKVSELINELNTSGVAIKVYSSGFIINTAADFNMAQEKMNGESIGTSCFLMVKAEDDSLKKYTINPLSSVTNVTTVGSHYFIDQGASTITSDMIDITTNTTVADFLNNLNLPTNAMLAKVTDSGITFGYIGDMISPQYDIYFKDANAKLANNDKLWIVSEDGLSYKVYDLDVIELSSDNAATSSIQDKLIVDSNTNIISSGTFRLRRNTRVDDIYSLIDVPVGAQKAIFPAGTTMEDSDDWMTSPTAQSNVTLESGFFLTVRAENGDMRNYTIKPLSWDSTVTAIDHQVIVDNVNNTISSNTFEIKTTTTAMDLFMIIRAFNQSCGIGISKSNEIYATRNDLLADTTNILEYTDTLVNGYKLWIIAEDEVTMQYYTINVLSDEPVEPEEPVNVAPEFINGFPSVSDITSSSVKLSLKVNETGIVKGVILPAGSPQPTVDYVKLNSVASLTVEANTTKEFNIPNLAPSTSYVVYVVAIDELGLASLVLESVEFTTLAVANNNVPDNPPDTVLVTETVEKNKIDVIVNGIKEAIADVLDTLIGGKLTTVLTVDFDSLKEKLEREVKLLTNGEFLQVVVSIPETAGSDKQASFSYDVMKQLVENRSDVTIETSIGSYTLDNHILKTILGENTEKSFNVLISPVDDSKSVKNFVSHMSSNTTLLSNFVDFNLNIDGNGINQFDDFIPRTITQVMSENTLQALGLVANDIKLKLDPTTGVVLGENGVMYPVPSELYGSAGNISVIINSLSNSVYGLVSIETHFSDIEDSIYKSSINNIASRMIIEGTSKTTFSPNRDVTRAEFATMLTKSLGLYRGELGKTLFNDMSANQALNVGITVAADHGFISGYGNGLLKPNQSISQKEFAQMLYNAAEKIGRLDLFDNSGKAIEVSGWSANAVKFATGNVLIQNFDMEKPITREQAAYALEQFLIKAELINE